MYDIIVIGARCAGAPTAMLLARKGHRVLLVDRARFPSDIPHGHFIHQHGPRRLAKWGVLERIVATGCPPVTSFTADFGDFALTGHDLVVDDIAFGYGPRRIALDRVLVEAAVDAGAELRAGYTMDEVIIERDRVVGIRGHDRHGGSESTERATVVVGADGRNSRVARAVHAPTYADAAILSCWYFSYWSGVPATELEMYLRSRRAIFAFPTNDGLFAIMVSFPASELSGVRADIEREFMTAIDRVPELSARVRAGRREERFSGATDLPNFFRKPYGPGWALVGDAGCHKDPFLALGVCDALRDAELLADALDDALTGRRSYDAAMAGYERRRNEATMPSYEENLRFASLEGPPAQLLQLRAALRHDPEGTRRFYMAREGQIPFESFFNPENMGQLMARAAPSVNRVDAILPRGDSDRTPLR